MNELRVLLVLLLLALICSLLVIAESQRTLPP